MQTNTKPANSEPDMQGKSVVITGANSGIGLAAAAELARRGARVGLLCRSLDRAEVAKKEVMRHAGHGNVEVIKLDLASLASVREAASQVNKTFPRLDVFINNAGVALSDFALTEDGFERTLQVNHLAPLLLTDLLFANLAPRGRVINLSSNAHKRCTLDFNDLGSSKTYKAWPQYCRTKLMNVLCTRALAAEYKANGSERTVNAVHPGVVGTNMTADGDTRGAIAIGWSLLKPFMRTPERGAQSTVFLASDRDLDGKSGGYYFDCALHPISRAAENDADAQRLMTLSRKMLDERPAASSGPDDSAAVE